MFEIQIRTIHKRYVSPDHCEVSCLLDSEEETAELSADLL
jgi:hypothetical protein